MAYIQRTTPPPNRIMTMSQKNFVGGLNNRSEILEPNQCSDVINMAFSNDTIMEKRKGQEQFGEFETDAPITFIDEFKPYQDEDKMIKATNSVLYVDGVKLLDLHSQVSGVNYNGRYHFIDGDKIYVYGKFHQTETTYQKITGTPIDEYIVVEVVKPPDGHAQLDDTHTRGITRINYTTKQIWYEPCKLEAEDANNGFNVPPEKPKFLVVHHGRLFVSGAEKDNDNVFISDVRNGYYFPVSLPMQLPPNSDKVDGLVVYDDAVVVSRERDMYSITGMTNNPESGYPLFRLRKINVHCGFANQQSVRVAHNYLFYLGSDGNVYALSSARNDEKVLSTTIISRTLDLFEHPINLTREDIRTATSYFYNDEFWLSIKDKVLIYSYRNQAWTMYNHLDARSFYDVNHHLIWGNDAGILVKHSDQYLDFGIPFKAFWTSKNYDMDDANAHKQFREFFIVAHSYEQWKSDIRLTFEIDYVDVKSQITLQNQIAIYGRAVWGDRFITRNINASVPFVIGRRGRTIRFRFANGYDPSEPVETYDELRTYVNRKNNTLVWVSEEERYYLFFEGVWHITDNDDLNQTMKIYQVNGDYEFRGKR